MRNVQALWCAALLMCFLTGCVVSNTSGGVEKVTERSNSISIMTWNVQAVFDGTEEGTEYDEYRESSGWNREKYLGRLNVIAGAIGGMEQKPDIIALQEIESAQVTTGLAGALSAQGYRWTHFANIPEMSLGLGLISRYPVGEAKSHSVTVEGGVVPRPMLEVRINADEPLALFICHWKSKLGGDDATESIRRASARIILRRIRELAQTEPNLPVIVMGDLNENYDEFYRRNGKTVCALLPDDPRAAAIAGLQKDFIVMSKHQPPEVTYFPAGVVALYSPWAAELTDGTYYYKNEWETIDHFLLAPQLFDGSGWDFAHCEVINVPPFVNAKGQPAAYNPRTGSGLSDHLPLLLLLHKRSL